MKPNNLKGRPTVAGRNSPTQVLSSLTEKIHKPIVPCSTSYVKDDWHFIKQLLKTLKYEITLYSCDTEGLYTSIAIDPGLVAISYWLNDKSNLILKLFPKNFILEALEFLTLIISNLIKYFTIRLKGLQWEPDVPLHMHA